MLIKLLKKIIIILFVLYVQIAQSSVNIIPSERRIDWDPGLPNGIPYYSVGSNVKDFGALGDGLHDDTQAFISAVNAASSSSAILIPSGTYRITSGLQIGKKIVLRGQGSTKTRLKFELSNNSDCISLVRWGESDWINLTGGLTKGSNTIQVANTSAFNVGNFVEIIQTNDPDVFHPGTAGIESWGDNCVGQMLKIISISGDSIAFEDELYYNYNLSMNPRVRSVTMLQGAGVEKLCLERVNASVSGSSICMQNTAYCWIKKVSSEKTYTSHVYFSRAYKCEVRESYFNDSHVHGDGGQGYGIRMDNRSSNNLIENNIFVRLRHSMLIQLGATGNVFGYNYSKDPFWEDGNNWLTPDISVHGHYPYMNLFEGNTVQRIMADNVHGTNGPTTFFRNRIEKDVSHYLSSTSKFGFIEIDANNSYHNIVGNELGISDTYATTPIELDPSISNTIIVHGNYNYINKTLSWDPAISDRNLPDSYYLNGKPSWFGSLPWPVIGGDVSPNSNLIPAQQRYKSGNFIPESGDNNPPLPPKNLRVSYTEY